MPSISRILEILFYSLAIFVPWLFMSFYPFRNRLRLNSNLVALLTAVMAAARIAVDMTTGLGIIENSTAIQLALLAAFVLFFFVSVRGQLVEMIANMAVVLALAFLTTTTVKNLEPILTPALNQAVYNWAYTVILLALSGIIAVIYGLLYQTVKNLVVQLWTKITTKAETTAGEDNSSEASAEPAATEECTEPTAAAAEEEKSEPAPVPEAKEEEPEPTPAVEAKEEESEPAPVPEAKEEEPEPAPAAEEIRPDSVSVEQLHSLQYTNLNSRILESRQVRGSVRRSIDAMTESLNAKNYDRLRAQMMALRQQCTTTSFSKDVALSATLDYFTQLCSNRGIHMNVDIRLPEDISKSVVANDLIVLLGNLLDNALDACKLQRNPDRHITVLGDLNEQTLRFVVENTYEQPVVLDEDGVYQSIKYDGPGAGLKIVQRIVSSYDGYMRIDHTDGIFKVAVTLNIQ